MSKRRCFRGEGTHKSAMESITDDTIPIAITARSSPLSYAGWTPLLVACPITTLVMTLTRTAYTTPTWNPASTHIHATYSVTQTYIERRAP